MVSQYAYSVYLKYWLKSNLNTLNNEQFKIKILSFNIQPELTKEIILFVLDSTENVLKIIDLLESMLNDTRFIIYNKYLFEALLNALLINKQFQRVIDEVAVYETQNGENSITLSAKITALSSINFELYEDEINELIARSIQ
jgi:hypothetical protein